MDMCVDRDADDLAEGDAEQDDGHYDPIHGPPGGNEVVRRWYAVVIRQDDDHYDPIGNEVAMKGQ